MQNNNGLRSLCRLLRVQHFTSPLECDPSKAFLLYFRVDMSRVARIRLHLDFAASLKNGSFSNVSLPSEITFKAPLHARLHKLTGHFRDALQRELARDGVLLTQLRKANCVLHLTATCLKCNGQREEIYLDDRACVGAVGDLFEDPSAAGLELEADGIITAKMVPKSAWQSDSFIRIREPSIDIRCLRIGNVPLVDDYCRDPSPQDVRLGSRQDGPGYSQPLLVRFDKDFKKVSFFRAHAYDFDDFCIGNPEETLAGTQVKFDNAFHFFGPFQHVLNKQESRTKFIARLRKHIQEGGENLGNGMPFLPKYCYNTYKAAQHCLGVKEWPKQGIDVAIRCVNHYKPDCLPKIAFPPDNRTYFESGETLQDVVTQIKEEIDFEGLEDDVEVNSALLFKDPHAGQWDIALWVMPQRGPKKLYRYTEGDLTQFLDPSTKTRTKDKRLYMEAHIISKQTKG